MIALLLENVPFEQDIRELFMAFFPSYKYVYDREAKITLRAKKEEKFYKFEINIIFIFLQFFMKSICSFLFKVYA